MPTVDDLFTVTYGVNLEFCKMAPDKNGIPFISRRSKNNGMAGRVKLISGIEPITAGTISVSCGGSVMESFLQKEPYYSGRDICYLTSRISMSDTQKLFYTIVLHSNKYRYSFGRQANKTLPMISIPAPEEIPDWVAKTKTPQVPTKQPRNIKRLPLTHKKWEWFRYGAKELFAIKKGERLTKEDMVKGNTPFIGAIDSNNGYRDLIDRKPNHQENTLTVNYNGSVAETFYQPRPYWASDDCNVIYLKEMNQYIGMFLATLIKMEKYRFNYGRKWHKKRMEKSPIRLPVNDQGAPDWQFMEDYIKGLPYSKNLSDS